MQASGVVRGSPDLAPFAVRITPGSIRALSITLPRVSLCTALSMAGMKCGAILANSMVEETFCISLTPTR